MNKRAVVVIALSLSLMLSFASAHPGGTDSKGGHAGSQPYHYHHGYSAHDHTNDGEHCPILYKEGYNNGYEKHYKRGKRQGIADAFITLLPFPVSLFCAGCTLAFLSHKLNKSIGKE